MRKLAWIGDSEHLKILLIKIYQTFYTQLTPTREWNVYGLLKATLIKFYVASR